LGIIPHYESPSFNALSSPISSISSKEYSTISGTSRNSMIVILNAEAILIIVPRFGVSDFPRRMLLTVE
jgi:hypothetical protein